MVSSYESNNFTLLFLTLFMGCECYDVKNVKLRTGRILASVKFESWCSDLACVDWGPYRCRLVMCSRLCSTGYSIMWNGNHALGVWRWWEYHVHIPVNPLGTNDIERWVLCSRVALDQFTFWRIWVKVDKFRFATYICRVVRKPQLGQNDSNHRYFSVKKTWSSTLHRS
jgi:hypothetical protein